AGPLAAHQRPTPALVRRRHRLTRAPRPGLHWTHVPHPRQRRLAGRRFRGLARPARATGGEDGTGRHEPGGIPRRLRARRGPLPPLPGRAGAGRAARAPAHRPRSPGTVGAVPGPGRWRALTPAATAPIPPWPAGARAWTRRWNRRWTGW